MMMNTIVEVGRITYIYDDAIELKTNEGMDIVIDVSSNLMQHVKDYMKVEDLIGIKAHLETKDRVIKCVADKLTYLSSKKGGEENE